MPRGASRSPDPAPQRGTAANPRLVRASRRSGAVFAVITAPWQPTAYRIGVRPCRPASTRKTDHQRAGTKFDVKEMHAVHLMALEHAETIVIDPLSDVCVVITRSHNFSVSASEENGESLAIVRGTRLGQVYALAFDQNGHLLPDIVPSLEGNPTQSLDR